MPSAVNVAGEIAGASTALAGFLLVFLGLVANRYSTYEAAEKSAVRSRYQMRAWFAFVGFALTLVADLLALLGKWLSNGCLATTALAVLVIAMVWVLLAGIQSVREIK